MNKYLTAAGVAGALGIAALSTAGVVSAQSESRGGGRMDNIVTAIAEQFGLNQEEVQQVFEDERAARRQEREAELNKDLAQLVSDGELTQEQSNAISEKRSGLQAEREKMRESDQSLTRDEMGQQRESHRTELQEWANENDISSEYLRYVVGGHGWHHGPRGFGGGAENTSEQ